MPPYLHRIATAVPAAAYRQESARAVMKAWIGGDRRTDLLLSRVYGHSGIDVRHSVVGDFAPGADSGQGGLYVDDAGGFRNPGTAERNERYRAEAGPLFVRAADAVLAGQDRFDASEITHLVTVSCTGFYAPGPDLEIVRALGLRPGVERYHLGFMGCYAAFPALNLARTFCRADPNAVVLVVAAELCTLHLQPETGVDAIIAASVFADGAAAALVSGLEPAGPSLSLEGFADAVAPGGSDEMAWTIGDTGFEMVLSSYVPDIVGAETARALEPLLRESGMSTSDVSRWAVHPGGRAILDRVEEALNLQPRGLTQSREVLRDYGNMSSATVLFVLERMLAEERAPGEAVAGLAFGPGLTIASGLFRTA